MRLNIICEGNSHMIIIKDTCTFICILASYPIDIHGEKRSDHHRECRIRGYKAYLVLLMLKLFCHTFYAICPHHWEQSAVRRRG